VGLRRKGKRPEPRGHHGTVKLRGGQTWARHCYGEDGQPETIRIWVPEGYGAAVFGFSVTSGFCESNKGDE